MPPFVLGKSGAYVAQRVTIGRDPGVPMENEEGSPLNP